MDPTVSWVERWLTIHPKVKALFLAMVAACGGTWLAYANGDVSFEAARSATITAILGVIVAYAKGSGRPAG